MAKSTGWWGRALFYLAYALGLLVLLGVSGELFLRAISSPEMDYTPGVSRKVAWTYRQEAGGQVRFSTHDQPLHAGRTRIMLQGDSITEATHLPDWRDIYTNILEQWLDREPGRYELSVFARAGWEMDDHLRVLRQKGPGFKPEIIVYQWYLNDLEIRRQHSFVATSPVWQTIPWWRRWPGHDWLWRHSYFWHFADTMLTPLIYGDESYTQYLARTYGKDTLGWAVFERDFRRWLTLATSLARRVILFLYPGTELAGQAVGDYALAGLHERVAAVAGRAQTRLPAVLAAHTVGEAHKDAGGTYGEVWRSGPASGKEGMLIYGGPYVELPAGTYHLTARLKLDGPAQGKVARLEASGKGGVIAARREIEGNEFKVPGQWREFRLEFRLNQPLAEAEFRLVWLGRGDISVDWLSHPWPIPPRVEVVDAAPFLVGRPCWVSRYDAHPNAACNRVMARLLYEAITGKQAPGKP